MKTKEKLRMGFRWVCFALLLTATVFRLADVWISAQEEEAPLPVVETNLAQWEYPTVYYSLPERYEVSLTAQDAAYVQVDNRSGLQIDIPALLTRELPFDPSVEGPLILIVHTHATEAYTMTEGARYEESSAYRTPDTEHNVVRVGRQVCQSLNELGIETIHDTTLNDMPGYENAYERTARVIEAYLEEYPSIQMVIDIHRDAVAAADGSELAMSTQLEGERAARLLLVMGTNSAGLEHPAWESNLSLALQMQALCEKDAPGLFRELSLRAERYNQHLTPCSILLEVGTAGNTLEEALRSAEYFARQLSALLLCRK